MTTEGAIVFGLDAGNSEATGAISSEGNSRVLTIPAEIGAGQLRELERIRGGAGAKGRLAPGEYVLEVDGASNFVGRLALHQSAEASSARRCGTLLDGTHAAPADGAGRQPDQAAEFHATRCHRAADHGGRRASGQSCRTALASRATWAMLATCWRPGFSHTTV